MDLKILLIGILYVAQSVTADVILKEPITSPEGIPISCGTRWRKDGVLQKIFYDADGQRAPLDEEEGGTMDEADEEGMMDEADEEGMMDESLDTHPSGSGESQERNLPSTSGPVTSSDTRTQVNVYEFCRNEKTKLVMYTKYSIQHPESMKPSREKYDRQGSVITGPYEKQVSDVTDFSSHSDTRDFYEKIINYDSQRVVIPDFSPDVDIRNGFYEFDISAPLNTELKTPWLELIQEIKRKIHKIKEPIDVYSGTYDTYRLHGVTSYLDPVNRKLPVPFAWWILLHNQIGTQGISVIMQNFAFSPGEETNLLCSTNLCSQVGLQVPKYSRAHIYCCPAQTINDEYAFTQEPIKELFDFN